MASVWGELKRRNVVKVAVAYAIVGWLLIEIAATVLPLFEAPDWIAQVFAFFVILGFPLALILSWAYELTPEGMERTKSVPASESITHVTGQKLNYVIIGVLVLAVGFMFVDNYLPESGPFAGAEIDPASLGPELDEIPSAIVEEATEPTPARAEEEQREVLPNSVAVLLFDNLSPNPDDAYFAAGLHDEILNQLQKLSSVSVISRTSVLRYTDSDLSIPEIARELNVETVMEGTVRYADDRVRITTQLIDATTDEHLWSETYDREFEDIFAIESDIAMNIANALEAEFSLAEQERIEQIPTDSPAAYALYLKARTYSDTRLADLNQAIELDPEFALAYALKAYFYALESEGTGLDPAEAAAALGVAREAAEQSLLLDSANGLAHGALGILHVAAGEVGEAQAAYESALELSPNDPDLIAVYARFNRYVGQYGDAIRLSRRSVELDPNNQFVNAQLAFSYWYAHNYDDASDAFQRTIDLGPTEGSSHLGKAFAEVSRGNYDEALRELQFAEEVYQGGISSLRLGQFAFAYGQMGRPEEARRFLSMLEASAQEEPVTEAVWAMAYFAVANYEEAFRRLENAVTSPQAGEQVALSELKANAYGDPVLDEPRWRELRDRIGVL